MTTVTTDLDPVTRPCHKCTEAEWLALSGEAFQQVAARLGLLPKSLETHLRRHGRTDLIPPRDRW